MARYRRRRARNYGWRRWRRYRGPLRWRRKYYRRRRRPARRVRVLRRRKKLATFWDPINIAKCKISGWDFGLFARNQESVQRLFLTHFDVNMTTKHPEGGGVSLKIFDLRYLFDSHRLYKNRWSHSNDGFDLARYLGTTVYLKPHPTHDYIFFWDTDLKREQPFDILRMQPANQLNSKNVVFIRSQMPGGNHKTKKIRIKPPANILNQWQLQGMWIDIPLFMYGFVTINWRDPFLRTTEQPIQVINLTLFQFTSFQQQTPTGKTTVAYSPYIDTGIGNMVGVKWQSAGTSTPVNDQVQWIQWTKDLPYWMTLFGQDKNMSFDVTTGKSDGFVTWIFIQWPMWSVQQLLDGKRTAGDFKLWAGQVKDIKPIPLSGPFILPNYDTYRINIPFLYKSHWLWGGTQLVQQPLTALKPTSNQISVKNPATELDNLIYPWDLSGGLLTKAALKRLTRKSEFPDERRPLPYEEPTSGYAAPARDGTESSEAETSEEESDSELSTCETSKRAGEFILGERNKPRKLKHLLRSLVTKRHSV
nr:ORF1 [Torque teno felis virus]